MIGCDDPYGRKVMERLYRPLALRNARVIFVFSRISPGELHYALARPHGYSVPGKSCQGVALALQC